ncbi:hypothetical protein QE400_000061 [Xanthomonas sacchari]|uniref:hypothetical protein n=1 Tax=Xanthomonas sacchari TaxID=56458 RepID=UPI00278B97E9|nr:hypothetical protein [Xanthomonas sacchari]MDQ1090648.1 hypothetical protein [Xanthomonas sacchari]
MSLATTSDLVDDNATAPAHALRQARVLVPGARMPEFTKRLAALNTKAAAYGLDALTCELAHIVPYVQRREADGENEVLTLAPLPAGASLPGDATGVIDMHVLDLRFPIVKLGDWQVVAQFDATAGAGVLVFAVTDLDGDREEARRRREHPLRCDHCRTTRARKQTYLLRDTSTTGAYQQVGSTCLQEFTGIDPAAVLFLARLSEFERDVEKMAGDGAPLAADAVPTLDYLARVIYLCESRGFISASKAREQRTSATYRQAIDLDDQLRRNPAAGRAFAAARERLLTEAAAIVAWFAEREVEAGDDFTANVRVLLASDRLKVDPRHLAVAAAAVPSYLRAQSAALHVERTALSVHVGTPDERIQRSLRVYQVESFDGYYGPMERISLLDDGGNCFTWRTGAASAPPALISRENRERRFECTFKVKLHDTYRGSDITEISHLRFKRWLP